jgi:acyl dehydratase
MRTDRLKTIAAGLGVCAVVAAAALTTDAANDQHRSTAGGSGDSATGTNYTSPTLKPMSVGSTVTATTTSTNDVAPMSLGTSDASPTFKATPAGTCVNNGQCP